MKKRAKFNAKMRLTVIVLGIILIILIAIIFYPSDEKGGNGVEVGTAVGQMAPDFKALDTENNNFSLLNLCGSIVILNFMAINSVSCQELLEQLKIVHNSYNESQVKVVSFDINLENNASQVREYKINHGYDWIFSADASELLNIYHVTSIPYTYIINEHGIISFKYGGYIGNSTLRSEIDRIL